MKCLILRKRFKGLIFKFCSSVEDRKTLISPGGETFSCNDLVSEKFHKPHEGLLHLV